MLRKFTSPLLILALSSPLYASEMSDTLNNTPHCSWGAYRTFAIGIAMGVGRGEAERRYKHYKDRRTKEINRRDHQRDSRAMSGTMAHDHNGPIGTYAPF